MAVSATFRDLPSLSPAFTLLSSFVLDGHSAGAAACPSTCCGGGTQKPGRGTTTLIAAHPQAINTALIPISNFRG